MTYWFSVVAPKVYEEAERTYDLSKPHPFGFPSGRLKSVKRIQIGDRIISYMSRQQRFFAISVVTKRHYHNPTHGRFPECVEVERIIGFPPNQGISVHEIKSDLNRCRKHPDLKNWGGLVQRSAVPWDDVDGETILARLKGAEGSILKDRSSER